jgi:hypothetical protein
MPSPERPSLPGISPHTVDAEGVALGGPESDEALSIASSDPLSAGKESQTLPRSSWPTDATSNFRSQFTLYSRLVTKSQLLPKNVFAACPT